mmetsp:Transcript_13705/g.20876  ORF Transcript_13705/g.20876 Transcript_13705/m.20876 type:complete len:84 (-) Transcript_13705:662-913(-)
MIRSIILPNKVERLSGIKSNEIIGEFWVQSALAKVEIGADSARGLSDCVWQHSSRQPRNVKNKLFLDCRISLVSHEELLERSK